MNLQDFAKEIHAQNVAMGWWSKPNQCIQEKLMLVVTELAEGCEGLRKNLMDDHLPHRKMIEVELADALIRLLDLGEYLGLEYPRMSMSDQIWGTIESPAGRLMRAVAQVASISNCFTMKLDIKAVSHYYMVAIGYVLQLGVDLDLNVIDAAHEKCAYNRTRADHQLAARAAPGGKAF